MYKNYVLHHKIRTYNSRPDLLENAVLTKKDQKNNPIQGVVFTVQISTDNGTTWTDYVPEGASTALTLTTDAAGQVKLEDYPITVGEKDARFRLVETSVPAGYEKNIIDNSRIPFLPSIL